MKKIISVLTVVLILAAFSCGMFVSAETPAYAVSSVSVDAGEDATVTVSFSGGAGLIAAKAYISFDPSLTLKSVAKNSEIGGMFETSEKGKSPVSVNWVKVESDSENVYDTVFVTLTFGTENAKPGTYDIKVTPETKEGFTFGADKNDVVLAAGAGTLTVNGDGAALGVTTTGTATGDGDYTGQEVDPFSGEDTNESGDYSGPEVDPFTGEEVGKENTGDVENTGFFGGIAKLFSTISWLMWIWIIISALILIAAVVTVIVIKKTRDKNTLD